MQSRAVRNWSVAVILLILAAGPAITGEMYHVFVMNSICVNIMLVMALNFILGLAGQVFMGTIAFFAIASYVTGLLAQYLGFGFWEALPFSILITSLFSLLIGIPTLRISGAYLALMSMGFIVVVGDVLRNWMSFTGGPWGIPDIPRPTFGNFVFSENLHLFYLMLVFLAAMSLLALAVEDSRFGLAFKAVRDDQLATELCGLNSTVVKVSAFALCGAFTGVAGAFFATFQTYISPDIYTFEYNAIFMCMLVVGGLSSVPGAMLGGVILTIAVEILRPLKEKYVTVFALIIIVILLFEPGGLMVLIEKVWRRLLRLFGLGGSASPEAGGGEAGR